MSGGIHNDSTSAQTIDFTIVLTSGDHLIAANSGPVALNGAISGSGNLVVDGGQNVSLSAANTYTGTTAVKSGMLKLTGSGGIANRA